MFASAILTTAFLVASSTLVSAAPVPALLAINMTAMAMVEAAVNLPNTTQTNNATWFYQNGTPGACGLVSDNSELIVGLPLEFYNATGSVSPYCGAYVVVTNTRNNMTVTARVADATITNKTLSLSVGSYNAVHGYTDGLAVVTWVFANATQTAAAKAAVQAAHDAINAAASVAATATSNAAASSSQAAAVASGEAQRSSSSSADIAAYAAATTYAAAAAPAWTPAPYTPAYTPSTIEAAWTPAYTPPAPAYTPPAQSYSESYNGMATFYYQNGAAGACGNYNSDSAYIVAIDSAMYNGGANCGRQVRITASNGAQVTATVADMCPSCVSNGSLDLSVAAFDAIAVQSVGTLGITWSFV